MRTCALVYKTKQLKYTGRFLIFNIKNELDLN